MADIDKTVDLVNRPPHYNQGKFEVIDVLDDWNLPFCLANAVKYIARCRHKGNMVQDLRKAIWYIDHEIGKLEKPSGGKSLEDVKARQFQFEQKTPEPGKKTDWR